MSTESCDITAPHKSSGADQAMMELHRYTANWRYRVVRSTLWPRKERTIVRTGMPLHEARAEEERLNAAREDKSFGGPVFFIEVESKGEVTPGNSRAEIERGGAP